MTTRAELFAIANQTEPLRRPLLLPYRATPLLEDVLLMSGDAQAATQAALAQESSLETRDMSSPLIIPEMARGGILSGKA